MTEIARLIHLIASMQILFGSRRGGLLVPLLLIGIAAGGWFGYQYFMSPERQLEKAHMMYESSDVKVKRAAIFAYKDLLNKSDPIEPGRHWLTTDRDTLYRRIIQHEVINAEDEVTAGEWAIKAFEDGFSNLRFQNERVKAFWEKTADSFRKKKTKGKRASPALKDPAPQKPPGKFDKLPGIDKDARWRPIYPTQFSFA